MIEPLARSRTPIAIPRLDPKRTMLLDAPCWCRSGKPWGDCHKDRDKARRPPTGKLIHELERIKVPPECAHPEADLDCTKISNAHTIQRRGGLSAIEENGHVGYLELRDGVLATKPVGLWSASTFTGFCNKHDTAMFAPIETGKPLLNNETLFLFAYRALAYARFMKTNAFHNVSILRDLDAGCSFDAQVLYQQHQIMPMLTGIQWTLTELNALQAGYALAYRTGDYAGFQAMAWMFDEPLPIAYAGAFHPEQDIHGTPLQRLAQGAEPQEIMNLCLTPWYGGTLFTLGWMGAAEGPCGRYAAAFAALADSAKANTAMHAGFAELSNLFFRQSWWDALPAASRDALESRRMAGTETGPDRQPSHLASATPVLSEAGVLRAYGG